MTPKCAVEIQETLDLALRLSKGTANQRLEAEILRQKAGMLERRGHSTFENMSLYVQGLQESLAPPTQKQPPEYRVKFERYIGGQIDAAEFRDWLAGTQSITYTQGVTGGFFVPFEYDATLREAMAQVDPILDEKVCDFSLTTSESLQPEQVSGYDLSTISAQLIGETVQQNPQTIPSVAAGVLRTDKSFKASFAASIEAEQDIPSFTQKITRAASVALARRIGLSVLTGRGGADISGVLASLSSSYTNGTSGKLVLADFNAVYFGVNRWYRAASKAAWLMSDGVYKFARAAVDGNGRPLLNIERDTETIFGKPVYVSPSLANAYSSLGVTGALIFGDLSHIVIRASRPRIQRATQLAGLSDVGGILRGECEYIGRARADAAYFDPSGGNYPPLVLATVN